MWIYAHKDVTKDSWRSSKCDWIDVLTGDCTCCCCGKFGRLFLIGQSAGAHLSTCALVWQAVEESEEDGPVLPWKPSQFKAFMGISGGWATTLCLDSTLFSTSSCLQTESSRLERILWNYSLKVLLAWCVVSTCESYVIHIQVHCSKLWHGSWSHFLNWKFYLTGEA